MPLYSYQKPGSVTERTYNEYKNNKTPTVAPQIDPSQQDWWNKLSATDRAYYYTQAYDSNTAGHYFPELKHQELMG